ERAEGRRKAAAAHAPPPTMRLLRVTRIVAIGYRFRTRRAYAVSARDSPADARGADPARLPRADDRRGSGRRGRRGLRPDAPRRQFRLRLRGRRRQARSGAVASEPGCAEEPRHGLRRAGHRGDRPGSQLLRGLSALLSADRDSRRGEASLPDAAPRDRRPEPRADRRRADRRLPETLHAGRVKKITVLGCGLVGAAIARDLSREKDLEVTVADANREALGAVGAGSPIRRLRADLSYPETIAGIVADADAVVGALPGRLGFRMLEAVISAGKPIADISFSPEDPLSLDGLAREKGITAVVD